MKRIFLGVMVCLFTLLTTTHSQEHKAVFSDFIYEGHDVYYEHHPLKQIDQAYNPILPGWYSDPSLCADGKGKHPYTSQTTSTRRTIDGERGNLCSLDVL